MALSHREPRDTPADRADGTEHRRLEDALRLAETQLEAERADTRLLQAISASLIREDRVEALYEKIVDAAVSVMRADYASMQMLYPERGKGGELRLLAFRGFTQDFLPFVFDRFRQGDGSAARLHGGLGLGLGIVRHIVELHGGSIRAESAGDGLGATFVARLPIAGPSTPPQ